MRVRNYRPSKRTVFVGLMVLSAIAVFLPPWITDASKHGTQLLVPLQDAAYFATHWAAKSVADIGNAAGANVGSPMSTHTWATHT